MVGAAASFATMGVLVKAIATEVGAAEIVFWRSLVALAVASAIGRGTGALFRGVNHRILVVRGLVGVASMICYFNAIARLPVGDAVLLSYLSPLLVASFSRYVLGERPSRRIWASLGLGLLGVAIAVGPQGAHDPIGVAFGLVTAVFAASAYVSVKLLTRTDDSHTIVVWFSIVSMVVTSTAFLDGWTAPVGRLGWILLAIGAIGTVAQYALTRAYAAADAARVSVFVYATPVLAYVLGLVALGEVPPLTSALGASVVVLAGLTASWPTAAPKPG